MAPSRVLALTTLCLAASLVLQVDARPFTNPDTGRSLLESLNNGCNGGSPTCYTSGGGAGYCCPEGYNCYANDKFACYGPSESGTYPSAPDLIVGESVAGGGVSTGPGTFPASSDPQCKNTPGRSNPCFSDDGNVNVCCSSACGPKTKLGLPTCSGECSGPSQLLYVWAGVSADGANSNARDYVGVVSLDRNNQYGQLLYRAEIPWQGTEAHHMGQSPDSKWLVAGGVFASVQGLPQVYFYDIEDDPYHPVYTGAIDPKNSGITDQVVFDSQGRAIITQMGSYNGGTPGRLLEITPPFPSDVSQSFPGSFAEYGAGGPGEDTMNPHGLDVNADSTVAITGDFIEPVSLFASSPDQIKFRDTLRIWRRDGSGAWINTQTLTIPGAGGVQDIEFIPGDAQERAIATLVNGNALALVNPTDNTAKVVYNFDNQTCIPHVGDVSNDGKRFFVSCIGSGQIWMLDISDPEHPVFLDAKDTGGPASNPHFVRLSPDNDRVFVSNYFVTAGLASSSGSRTVLSFLVGDKTLTPDTAFGAVAFDAVVDSNGVQTHSRPHGMTVNYLNC